MLLSAATQVVNANLKQDKDFRTNSPRKITERVESTILPLVNFHHMTQIAVARNWRLATPEQQKSSGARRGPLCVCARTNRPALVRYRTEFLPADTNT